MSRGMKAGFLVLLMTILLGAFCGASADELKLELDAANCEKTIYEDGTDNWITSFDIVDYETLKAAWGGEPVWSICAEDGGATPFDWSNASLDGKSIWLYRDEPAPKGDYTAILSCSWNGQTASAKITAHVVSAPNGPLLGSTGIEDEYVLELNQEIHLNVQTIPANWSLPGERLQIEHWVTRAATPVEPGTDNYTYESDGEPFFHITYGSTAGDITLKALMPGVYKTSFYVQCANYAADREGILITVKNADGSIPEVEIPTLSFTESEITVRANEPYVLKYSSNISFQEMYLYGNNGETNWEDETEYTVNEETGEITCITKAPGCYTVSLSYWSNYLNKSIKATIQVNVLTETGDMPLKLTRGDAEYTLYEGGTNNYLNWYDISGYDQLKAVWGGEPEWSICAEDGGETPISWINDQTDGKLIWLGDGNPNPAVKGDYTAILTCSWHGQTVSAKITVHVIPAPNGPLLGSAGIEDEYVLDLNEELHLNVKTVPENWAIPGERLRIEHWVTYAATPVEPGMNDYTYKKDGDPFFHITYGSTAGDITLKALMPGIYKTSFYVQCANYEVNRVGILITVKNADGTIPEPKMPTVAFTDSEITVRANEPYTLKFTSSDVSPDHLDVWYYDSWGDYSEYTLDGEAGEIKCVTSKPGYYQVVLACWDYFQENWVETGILVKVADENGNLPEVEDIEISPEWPLTAVVGDEIEANFSWRNAINPSVWSMDVEYNGSTVYHFDADSENHLVKFSKKGTYTLHCQVTDALGRTASASADLNVGDPSPLKVGSLEIVRTRTNGANDHDVWLKLSYSGGQSIASFHYQIFALGKDGNWFMTWETDSREITPYFWIGEDGDHYFKAQIADGTTTVEVTSPVITLGEKSTRSVMMLPGNLVRIEAEAFANNKAIQAVSIPDGVKEIQAGAFSGCVNLESVFIPSSVTTIDDTAFDGIPTLVIITDKEDSKAAEFAAEHDLTVRIGTGIN